MSELCFVLELYHVYYRYLGSFARKSSSQYELPQMHSRKTFLLTGVQTQAFQKLTNTVYSVFYMSIPRADLLFSVYTDASAYSLEFSLHQTTEEGNPRTIRYWSCSFNSSERNHSFLKTICIAIVWALKIPSSKVLYRSYGSCRPKLAHRHPEIIWLLELMALTPTKIQLSIHV